MIIPSDDYPHAILKILQYIIPCDVKEYFVRMNTFFKYQIFPLLLFIFFGADAFFLLIYDNISVCVVQILC